MLQTALSLLLARLIEENDAILQKILQGMKHQVQLRVGTVKYLGTIIGADSVKSDPAEVMPISEVSMPTDKSAVCCLLDIYGKFFCLSFPTVSSITALLHDLVKTDMHF